MAGRTIDTRDQKIGQGQTFNLPATGPVGPLEDEIETVDTPRWRDKAKMEAFMAEFVEIRVADTGGVNEEQFIDIGSNGVRQFVQRGVWQRVRRRFVEVLARAKRDVIHTPEFTDAAGNNSTRLVKTPVLRYPFEMRDKNPDGQVWLQRVLLEP